MMIPAAVYGICSLLAAAQSRGGGGSFTGAQLKGMLLWAGVILLTFLVASFAIHRFSKRYRAMLLRKPAPPTASDDVWKMHRLPESPDDSTPT